MESNQNMTIEQARVHPFVIALVAEGWDVKEVRDAVLNIPLSEEMVAALGEQLANDDEALREMRQEKNALYARLNREKKEREGAVSNLAGRVRDGHDEIGRYMLQHDKADYARRMAALRGELDAFLVDKAEQQSRMRERLKDLEDAQAKIAAKIGTGKGPMQVTVIDLADYGSGLVRTIRTDNGEQPYPDRPLDEHERQLGLFGQRVQAPPMIASEMTLAISGRIVDAAAQYAVRVGCDEQQARKAIRSMLPDDELPPEADDGMEPFVVPPENDDTFAVDHAVKEPLVDHKLKPTVFADRLWTVHLVGYEAKAGTKLAKKLSDVMGQKLAVAKAVLLKVEEYATKATAQPKDAPVIGVHVRDQDLGGFQLYIKNAGGDCFAIEEVDANNDPLPAKQEELWPASRIGKDAAAGES